MSVRRCPACSASDRINEAPQFRLRNRLVARAAAVTNGSSRPASEVVLVRCRGVALDRAPKHQSEGMDFQRAASHAALESGMIVAASTSCQLPARLRPDGVPIRPPLASRQVPEDATITCIRVALWGRRELNRELGSRGVEVHFGFALHERARGGGVPTRKSAELDRGGLGRLE